MSQARLSMCILSVRVAVFAAMAGLAVPGDRADRVQGWRSDIDSLASRIEHEHPNPWMRLPRQKFEAAVRELRDSVPRLDDAHVLTGLIRLAAMIEDGHTSITNLGPLADKSWFPIRFAVFPDGLWVTAIDSANRSAAGKRVVSIGGRPASEVVARLMTVASGDNEFNRRVKSGVLSNGMVLSALGLARATNKLDLSVATESGENRAFTLTADSTSGALDFEQYGEMFGPGNLELVTSFNRPPDKFLDAQGDSSLPLFLRNRKAYWWMYDEASRTLFFQMNNVVAKSRRSPATLLATWEEALSTARPVDRLVLDLRYNSGGDGSLIPQLLRSLIKHDPIASRGHFFVLTSGKTFSAAADFVITLSRFTSPIIVGEPPGVGLNASGDAAHFTLPYSKAEFIVSTRYSQNAGRDDPAKDVIPVNIPAPISGKDFVGKRDVAVEAILANPTPYPDVLVTLKNSGATAAYSLWKRLRSQYDSLTWWEPWRRNDLNGLSYDLLEGGRVADAVEGFRINTERFPGSWETWDSLGEAYLKAGREVDALRAYERAVEIDPHNWNLGEQQKVIQRLRSAPKRD